jgi:hypothetical protein
MISRVPLKQMISQQLKWLALLFALTQVTTSWAQSASEMTLGEVLDVAMARASSNNQKAMERGFQSSSWLAALPSISLSYLDSDEKYGTDETELSLNLPIKSGGQRKADEQLRQFAEDYRVVSEQSGRLFVAGLIREALWSFRIAEVYLDSAERKHQLLSELERQYESLVAAGAATDFSLLIIQRERVRAAIDSSDRQRELDRWRGQYRLVTGLGSMPRKIEETGVADAGFELASHPDIRLLELSWRQKQQRLLATSTQAKPWNVSVNAKNLDTPGFGENQYGIGVEIPLSFFEIATQSQNSEWLQESRDFELALDEARIELNRRWEFLVGEAASLERKQVLLASSVALSASITERANELTSSNELEQEIILRHQIEAIDARTALEINRTVLQQNNAMRLQAMGRSL